MFLVTGQMGLWFKLVICKWFEISLFTAPFTMLENGLIFASTVFVLEFPVRPVSTHAVILFVYV